MAGYTTAKYVDDQGNEFNVSIDDDYFSQACFGWVAGDADGTKTKFDGGFKPRVALTVDSSGTTRRIPCGNKAATAYTTKGTACITYKKRLATAFTAETYGWEGERIRHGVTAAPSQG